MKGEEDDIDFAVVGIDEKDVEEENCSLVPTDRQVLPRSWDHQVHKVHPDPLDHRVHPDPWNLQVLPDPKNHQVPWAHPSVHPVPLGDRVDFEGKTWVDVAKGWPVTKESVEIRQIARMVWVMEWPRGDRQMRKTDSNSTKVKENTFHQADQHHHHHPDHQMEGKGVETGW